MDYTKAVALRRYKLEWKESSFLRIPVHNMITARYPTVTLVTSEGWYSKARGRYSVTTAGLNYCFCVVRQLQGCLQKKSCWGEPEHDLAARSPSWVQLPVVLVCEPPKLGGLIRWAMISPVMLNGNIPGFQGMMVIRPWKSQNWNLTCHLIACL